MLTNYFQVLLPVVGLSLNVLSQVITFRYFKKFGLLRTLIFGFFIGLFTTTYLETINLNSVNFVILITNHIIYICLGYCYFHFVNLGETARRIRLLRELYDAPEGLTKEDILKRYNSEMIVNVRLGRLLNNGQIVLHDEKYYMGNSIMLIIARILVFVKVIVLGKKSEFDFKK